jgi:hypothetical protein
MNEVATELFFARRAGTVQFEDVEHALAAYQDALERILGLSPGSFPVVDDAVVHQWFD